MPSQRTSVLPRALCAGLFIAAYGCGDDGAGRAPGSPAASGGSGQGEGGSPVQGGHAAVGGRPQTDGGRGGAARGGTGGTGATTAASGGGAAGNSTAGGSGAVPSADDRPAAGNPDGKCTPPADAALEDVANPTTVIGDGSAASCTGKALVDAVAKGGVIPFNCGEKLCAIW